MTTPLASLHRAAGPVLVALGLLAPFAPAEAQVGSTTDIITGMVVNVNGVPLPFIHRPMGDQLRIFPAGIQKPAANCT